MKKFFKELEIYKLSKQEKEKKKKKKCGRVEKKCTQQQQQQQQQQKKKKKKKKIKRIHVESLSSLNFREDVVVTACRRGHIKTWLRPDLASPNSSPREEDDR